MNPGMIRRAIDRHRLMQDLPAYREFLEHLSSHRDAWLVPQVEIARWWESRQNSRLDLERSGPGRLRISSALAEACVQIDGGDPVPLPTEISLEGAGGEAAPVVCCEQVEDRGLLHELLGHLGYGHVRVAAPGQVAPVRAEELEPLLASLRQSGLRVRRFEPLDIERAHALFARGHHAVGLPSLRLWTLPHRNGMPYRVAVSSRYDVDKAIVNMPMIHDLEERHGLRSTAYLRPYGMFYGAREIRTYLKRVGGHEIALHGEFVTTAERFGDEFEAAREEKRRLEELTGRSVEGVCMHGGELRSNTTPNTPQAIEQAGYLYETMFRNDYYLPLHLPTQEGIRRTLSIGQHYADITVPLTPEFSTRMRDEFLRHTARAREVGGVFVPVMHPLYFGVGHYLRHPINTLRLGLFVPRFLYLTLKLRRGQAYLNAR